MSDSGRWKDHLGLYAYPPEIEEELRGRRRRRARHRYRQAHQQETRAYIAERRRQEPVTAGGAVVIVLVLIGLAFAGHLLMNSSTGGGHRRAVVPAASGPSPGTSMSAGPSPSVSPALSPDLSDATAVAGEFARHYLTRNPLVDVTHAASVGRAAPWMTQALAANLANSPDSDFDKLVSRGGVAKVTRVKVTAAGSKLPGDSPLRIWRALTVTISVHGYTSYTQTRLLRAELTRTGAGWLVSRLLGV